MPLVVLAGGHAQTSNPSGLYPHIVKHGKSGTAEYFYGAWACGRDGFWVLSLPFF